MTDIFAPSKRRAIMSRIQGKDTEPELFVRKLLHGLGYRFRLHRSDLPGKPDIVLPRLRKLIFVHGCFWHAHRGCRRASIPTTNVRFWATKLKKNSERDHRITSELTKRGWRVLVVWQCELRRPERLRARLTRFLEAPVRHPQR